jgi:two-component system alkaline phosphatase synthesis response regulator PhoP
LDRVGQARPWSAMPASGKILLVDDDPTVLDLVRETLEGCGYAIDTATNSQEAMERVKTGTYSMIILDLLLPDMNGFILAQEIKRLNPSLSERILFISGILFGQSTVDHLGSIGAGFLSKPFQLESLIEAVDRIANRRASS